MDELEPVRISRLKLIAQSPAHFHCQEEEDDSEQSETAAMEKGKFAHKHILQGVELAVSPCRRDSRMKQYQEFLADAENTGKLIVTKRQEKQLRGMKAAVLADQIAPALLQGAIEQTMLWSWMGRPCRGTPDVLAPEFVTELKTTRCAEPKWFQREADRRSYHTQLAWYEHGAMTVHGGLFRRLWIVAVESAPPYAVTCHEMEEERWQDAKKCIRLWFERLLQCEAANHWPAYTDAPCKWARNEERPWAGQGGATADGLDPEALA